MKTIIKILVILVILIQLTDRVNAQLNAVNEGSYSVSPINGFMSYTYPISNTTIDGYPVSVKVNYVSNATYTAYLKHYIQDGNDGWITLTKSAPAWFISVNGFVIQTINTHNTRFHSFKYSSDFCQESNDNLIELTKCVASNTDETHCKSILDWLIFSNQDRLSRGYGPYIKHKYDYDFIWLLDGYDYCNNIHTPDTYYFQDNIHILRDDGSVLDLKNEHCFYNQVDTNKFTGLYYENAENTNNFALVEYDTTQNWPTYLRTQYIKGENQLPLKPRVMRYYTNDGLEYVFREYVAPFGMREDLQRNGCDGSSMTCDKSEPNHLPKATIFYLEEINSSMRNLTTFKREMHKPTESSVEIMRGRAFIREFANHKITYSNNEILIETFGKVYKLKLDMKCLLSTELNSNKITNNANGDGKGFNIESWPNSISKSTSEELKKTYDAEYSSGMYFINEILDPENRSLKFNYEANTVKMYDIPTESENIFDLNDTYSKDYQTDIKGNIFLYNHRLKSIETFQKDINFNYKTDPENDRNKFTFESIKDSLDPDQFNIVSSVTLSERLHNINGSITLNPKFSTNYIFESNNTEGATYFRKTKIVNEDLTKSLTDTTEYFYSNFTVDPLLCMYENDEPYYLYPKLSSTLPICIRNANKDEVITTYPEYKRMDSILSGTSKYFRFPVRETQYFKKGNNDSLCLKKTEYEYEFSHIGNFDYISNHTSNPVYRQYDWAVTKKTVKNYRPDGDFSIQNILSKTVINYLNLNMLHNQTTYRYEATYNKQLSDYLTMRSFHFGDMTAINSFGDGIFTQNINVPPIIGLESEVINYDKIDNLISAKQNVYNQTYYTGPTSPEYRRGAIKEEYVKGRTGDYILAKTYNYHGGWERNMIEKETNLFGATARSYYKYTDIPGYNPNNPINPNNGKRMKNNQEYDYTNITQNYYQFEAPIATEAYIRKYELNDNGQIVLLNDTLRTVYEKNYFGQITGIIDNNGWYSQSKYDNIGRKLIERLPYDFPSGSAQTPFSQPLSDCTPITSAISTTTNTFITTQSGSQSGQSQITTQPIIIQTFKDLEFGKKMEFISQTENGGLTVRYLKLVDKSLQLVYEPSAYDAFHRSNSNVTDLKLKLLLEQYPNNCTSFNVKINGLNYETNFIVGCSPLSLLDDACDNTPSNYASPEVKIDLNAVKNAFVNLPLNQTITITLTTNTAGGNIRVPNLGNPYSPCLETQSTIQTSEEDDYTRKFEYNDNNLTQNIFAKVDDKVISEYDYTTKKTPNSYNTDNGKTYNTLAGRYTGTNQRYGVINNLLTQRILIGSPALPTRIDSITTGYSGLRTTDPQGYIRETVLDEYGRVSQIIYEDGNSKQYEYKIGLVDNLLPGETEDYFGYCVATIETNELGIRSENYSDALGNIRLKIIDSTGMRITTKYNYDELGRLIEEINPEGQSILYEYDDLGRVKTKQQVDIGEINYLYDKSGHLRFSQNDEQAGNNKFSFFEYDDLGRSTIVGEAKLNSFSFNSLSTYVNALNTGNYYSYNVYTSNPTIWLKNSGTVNKILSDTLNLSYFAYNKIRLNHYIPNISSDMNPYIDGLAGPYLMHEAKYYTPVTYPNAGYNNFEDISNYPEFVKVAVCYDKLPKKAGNIWENMPSIEAINKLAPKDALTNLKGQKSAIAYRDNATDPFHYVFFSYDARGRIEAIIRWTENIGFDVVHYTYNSMNKINSVTAIDAIRQFTTWNVYDNNGRIWKVYTRLGNTNTGFGHSADTINFANVDFPEPLERPYLPDITYNYNKRGGVDTVKYPASNVVKSFIYNPRGWVEEILAKKGTNDILFYQVLQRDAMGNVTQQTSKHRDPLIKASIYQYDTLNRLKEWTYNGGNNYEQYEYDDIGNRLSVNRSGSIDEYLYTGGNNKLYAVNLDGGKVRHLTYNNYGAATEIWETNNGTITKQEFWEYVNSTIPKRYRKENKDNSFNTLTYTNDMRNFNEWDWGYRRGAFDAREQKRLMKSPHGDGSVFANHTETDYIHSWEYSLTGAGGEELILYKGIQTVTSITLPAPNNTKTDAGRRVYIAPYKYYGAGGEVQIKANGEKEIHITDNLGSVRCIIVGDGTNIRSYDYKPFGELEWSSDNKTERKGFANAEYDGESSYFAMGIRMYSAEMGRFLAVDPMFEAMSRHTPYHYSFNSPLVYCDPSGLAPQKEKHSEKLQTYANWAELNIMSYTLQNICDVENSRSATSRYGHGIFGGDASCIDGWGIDFLECINNGLKKANVGSGNTNAQGTEGSGNNGLSYINAYSTNYMGYTFGYSYTRNGNYFDRSYYIFNNQGDMTYYESGYIDFEGNEQVTERSGPVVVVADGVDANAWLNGAQAALDTYSTFDQGPGGAVASVLSATISLYQGHYFDAGMSLLGAVPLIGVIGDAYKMGKIGLKSGKMINRLEKSGAYVLEFETGKFYVGKGLESRMLKSIDRLEKKYNTVIKNSTFYQADSWWDAYILEYQKMREIDAPLHWNEESRLYNIFWSPGKKLIGK